MAASKRTRGRPKKGTEVLPTKQTTIRLDPDLMEQLEEIAKTKKITLSRTIEQVIRTGLKSDEELEIDIEREFGGEHNLALGLLVARIALGVEHKRKRTWHGDQISFYYVLLAITAVLRDFLPEAYNNQHYLDPNDENETTESREAWAEIVNEVRDNLNSPQKFWWPLADGNAVNSIIDSDRLLRLISPLDRPASRTQGLDPEFEPLAFNEDEKAFNSFVDRENLRPFYDAQGKIESDGKSTSECSLEELAQYILKSQSEINSKMNPPTKKEKKDNIIWAASRFKKAA